MYTLVVILALLCGLLLILVVLAQNPKGGGLSSQFGGSGGASQIMGVQKTGDILEKLTWGFAIALLTLTLSTSFLVGEKEETTIESPNVDRANQRTVVPSLGGGTTKQENEQSLQDVEDLEGLESLNPEEDGSN